MKIKHYVALTLLAFLSLALTPGTARGQTQLTYNAGDVFLGFHASGGTGVTQDYLVNLGQVSQFTSASSAFTVPGIGNIAADLTATFGANWNTRADVLWGVSATVGLTALGSDPAKTLYASREQPAPGTPSPGWNRGSSTAQGTTNSKMSAMGNAFAQTAGVPNMSTANSPVALIQLTTDVNCYASYQPGGTTANSGPAPGTSFATYNPTIEGTFTNGTAGTVLDFVRLAPGSGPGTIIGTFTIDNSGVLTFTPASGAAPANVHFTLATYSGSEADASGKISIELTRDGNLATAFTVNFTTNGGTAIAGTDYTNQTNTSVSFAASQTTATVMVDVANRAGFQGDRAFGVSLSGASAGAAVTSPNAATVTILESSPMPAGQIAFSAATFQAPAVNAQSNPSLVAVTFTRTNGSTGAVAASVSVTGGTLINGTDYSTFTNPTPVSFADGVTTATVNIQLNNIPPGSLPGTIVLGLTNPTGGATLGTQISTTVTITPVAATVHFTSATYSGSEAIGGGQIAVALTREGNLSTAFTVNFSTTSGTAVAGTDFTGQTSVPVSFAAGAASANALVTVTNRAGFQGNRSFGVSLPGASAGATITTPSTATVTILEADPAPAGVIAFTSATFQSNALNGGGTPSNVAVTLSRTSGTTGAVSVGVSVTGGTLTNGTDYNTITNPTTVNFAAGAASATFNVQLKTIAANKLPGSVVLGLSAPTGGATLGTQTTTTLAVVSPGQIGLSAPTFTSAPVDNQAAPKNVAITLTRANGVNGAVSVGVSVTGGTLVNGTDYNTITNPTTVNFADGASTATFNIQLKTIDKAKLPGTIVLGLSSATGGASLGTQTTATVTITKPDRVLPTLVVTTPAPGMVGASFDITGTASDAKGIDRVEVTINGGAIQLATLGIFTAGSATFTLAGLAAENGKNTLVVTAVDSSGNKSLPTTVIVKYLNNRPVFAGNYSGLLVPAVTPTNKLSGIVNLTVTATGTFSGSATLGGFTVPVKGVFGNDGRAHFKPGLATTFALVGGVAPAPTVALGTLDLTIATDVTVDAKVTGSLRSDPSTVAANVSAPRAYFDGLTPATTVDSKYLQNNGRYTVVFPSKAQGALPLTSFPQGDGWGLITVTPAGGVTLIGKLADGSPVSASTSLARNYQWACYVALNTGGGSLAGVVTLDDTQPDSDLKGVDLLWIRPAITSSKYYPAGWTSGIKTDLLGAKFSAPVGSSILPGLGAVNPTTGNATIVFTDGKLTSSPLSKNLNIASTNLVTNAPTSDTSVSLLLKPASGKMGGSFLHSDNTQVAFKGVVFQKGTNAGGYGYFLSTAPAVGVGESGGVSVAKK